jgi:PKD repeat protein
MKPTYTSHVMRAMLCLLILMPLSTRLIGQITLNDTTNYTSPPKQWNVCSEDSFEIDITIPSALAGDSLWITTSLPTGIFDGTLLSTSLGSIVEYGSGTQTPKYRILLPAIGSPTTLRLQFSLKADCQLFTISSIPSFNINVGHYSVGVLQSNAVLPLQGLLVSGGQMNLLDVVRQNYNLAQLGVPFTRRFTYVNTGNLPFTGTFTFTDTVELALPSAAVRFRGISMGYLNSGSGSAVLIDNDSSVSMIVNLVNLAPDDSVTIVDTLELITCPATSINNTVTWFTAKYGCNTGPLCQNLHIPTVDFTTSQFNANDKPEITYRNRNPTIFCPANPDYRKYVIINEDYAVGTSSINGSASGARFKITKNIISIKNLSYVDTSTIQVYKFVSGTPVAVPFTVNSIINDFTSITQPHPRFFDFQINTIIPHGDSVMIEFTESKVCIDSTDYGLYFNNPVYMDLITLSAGFLHPCYPTGEPNKDPTKTLWNEPQQMFKLGQFFNNLNGTLTDLQEVWMDVNNTSRLFIGEYHPYFQHEVYIDSSKFQIELELQLDSGLCLILDSIYLKGLGVNAPDLYPMNVSVFPGNGVNRGTKDLVRARFKIPPSYFLPNAITANGHSYYGAKLKYSALYDSLFNNFAATFKVQAKCIYSPPGGFSNITENFFIIYDTTCTPDCKIPLASVSDLININCPGCYLPGWNLSKLTASRLNLGTADVNNNNYPDVAPLSANPPANINDAHEERIMKNDTLAVQIEAGTSDGENLLFNTPIFPTLKFGQLSLQGGLMSDLVFLGATGTYSIAGNPSTFTIPPTAGNLDGGGNFYIMLDKTDWYNYGLDTSAFFTAYNNGHSVQFNLLFRVKNNLNNGSGPDPYFSLEGINGFIYMSGTDFLGTTGGGKVDALNIPQDTIEDASQYNTAALAQLLYWCTGWEGRIVTVGADYQSTSLMKDYWGRIGYGAEVDPCLKTFEFEGKCSTGQPAPGMTDINQNALNAFSFELRNLWKLDSIEFTIPGPYTVERIELRYDVMTPNGTGTATQFSCGYFAYPWTNYSFANPTDSAWVNDSTIRIYPWNQIQNVTGFTSCGNNSSFYDETKILRIRPILKMKDCVVTPKVYNFNNYPIRSYWTDFPISGTNDTIITKTISGQFKKPFIDWQVQVLNVSNTTPGNDLVWTINVGTGPGATNTPSPSVNNGFFWFGPANGNVNINTVQWATPLTNALPVGSHNGLNIYGLGKIGSGVYNGSFGGRTGSITVKADYDCVGLNGPDSLMLIFGDNCYGYPDTLIPGQVCFMDTIYLPIPYETPNLQISTSFPDTIQSCDTNTFQLVLNAAGTGNIENVMVTISTPNNTIQYVPNSGQFSFGSNTSPVNLVNDTFDLSTLSYFNSNFNSFSPFAYLNFDLANWCNYDGSPIDFGISATNYCGDTIGPFNFSYSPTLILSNLSMDSLVISVAEADSLQGCSDSSLINIVITNAGTQPSTVNDTLVVNLPAGSSYVSGDPYAASSGPNLYFGINSLGAGASDTVSFWIHADSTLDCGMYPIPLSLLGHLTSTCDTVVCNSSVSLAEDTINLHIIKSTPVLTAMNLIGICSGDTIQVNISNASSVSTGNIQVAFYCTQNETGPLSTPCLLGTSSILSMGPSSTLLSTSVITPVCSDCEQVMAVIQEVGGCICSPDTLLGSINCDTVYQADADFNTSSTYICAGDSITFTSLFPNGTHYWNFGNGDLSTAIHPTYTYNTVGPLMVTHIVTDGPLSDTETVYITVINCDSSAHPCCVDSSNINPAAHCGAIWEPVCGCDQVTYINACLAQYVYGVGFWVPGPCSDSCNIQASFGYSTIGMSVNFNNTTSGSGPYTSNWDFGDANTSTLQHPTHLYTSPGIYVVTLTVQEVGDSGCFSVICDTVIIKNCDLVVNAGANDTVCLGSCVLLNANPGTFNGSLVWSPAAGLSNPNISNPTACPLVTTNYTLTVTDTLTGCNGQDVVTVFVNPLPDVSTNLNITTCQSSALILVGWHNNLNNLTASPWFTPSPSPNATISGSGLTIINILWFQLYVFNPAIAGPGVHNISYTVTNPVTGCSNTATGVITVHPNPVVTIVGNNVICAGTSTVLVANSTGTAPFTYQWNTGSTNNSITAGSPGTYSVTVTDANGCTGTASFNLSFSTPGPMNITTSNGTNHACVGDTYCLTATGGYMNYFWYQTSNPSLILSNSQSYCPTTSGTYCVYGVDASGCNSLVDCQDVFIYPLPVVTAVNPVLTVCVTASPFILGFHFGPTSPTYTGYFTPTPGDITSSSPGFVTSFWFDGFNPSLAGVGAHVINYTYTNPSTGCSNTASMTINVVGPPVISFPPIANIDLCSYNGTPVPINYSSSGGFCTISGPGVNAATNTFDPIAAGGAGTYTVTVTCSSHCGSSSATQTITVVDNNNWHQTTLSSSAGDQFNDITTDLQGNVYAVGTFVYQTTLNGGNNPNITINSVFTGFEAAMVAKYDKCANLIWVAHASHAKTNTGKSIVLDETNGLVYITGDYSSNVRFNSSLSSGGLCTSGYFQTISAGPNQGAYIAQYDMNTGCLYFVADASLNVVTDPEALAIDKVNKNIYVGGKQGNAVGVNTAYMMKYNPTTTGVGGGLNPAIWTITSTGSSSVANDLDYDEINNRLWTIGSFERGITFSAGGSRTTNPTAGISDAFLVGYTDLGSSPSLYVIRKGNIPIVGNGVNMTGEGVSVDDNTGNLCFTGSHVGNVSVPFQLGSLGINTLVNTTSTNAYMICADLTGLSAWSRAAEANPGRAFGYGVDIKDSVAYFTGNFNRNVSIDLMPANPYLHVGGPGLTSRFRTYVSAYEQYTGNALWTNVTESPTAGSHTPTAIVIDNNNNFFISGYYDGEMDYYYGTPASGNLLSTGVGTNGYILRGSQLNGTLRAVAITDQIIEFSSNDEVSFSIKAIPSPTTGIVELIMEGLPDGVQPTIDVFNLTGTVVYSGKITSERYTLDISHLAVGTYLIRVTLNNEPVTLRIIKI